MEEMKCKCKNCTCENCKNGTCKKCECVTKTKVEEPIKYSADCACDDE